MDTPEIIYGPFEGNDASHAFISCPGCRHNGWVGRPQFEGRVSIDCKHCDFHETIDLRGERHASN